jgi:nucleoside-triphosphatase
MQKRVLLLTGPPGIGKTTVLVKTINKLKENGYCIGGMLSCEVRKGGTRIGFKIFDLNSGKSGWLANTKQKSGPQIGKYRVNLENLTIIGTQAITYAVSNCCVVVIDEIGPMELCSSNFKDSVYKALASGKTILAIVHLKTKDKLVKEVKTRNDSESFIVAKENRETLSELVYQKTLEALKREANLM